MRFGTKSLFACLAILTPAVSLAWKPTTHVYLADQALADALDDGKVSIYTVDYTGGKILEKVGDYPVDPELLAALRDCRVQFRTGVLGPDVFPDIATGQSAIHPGLDPRAGGVRGDDPKEGADAWLNYLWRESRGQSKAIRAWTQGFLTHAAGDLFAHTFVNEFAGGEFSMGENALRHIVTEGYLDKRCQPLDDYTLSLDGVNEFVAEKLCRVREGSNLEMLLVGKGAEQSPIAFFGEMRKRLLAEKTAYDKLSTAQRLRYDVSNPGRMPYIRAWIQDIDDGLTAWPEFSKQVAVALMFNPKGFDKPGADAIVKEFSDDHLLSMMGLPDAAGKARKLMETIALAILTKEQREKIAAIERDFLNNLCLKTFGFSLDYLSARIKNPENYFDEVIGPGSKGSATARRTSLKDFNHDVLGLKDDSFTDLSQRWDWKTFPPAYNTVTLTKLSFLSAETINKLLDDLSKGTPGPRLGEGSNVLLDYQNSLDNDNQWHSNNGKLIFVRTGDYRKLFMKQIGERE